MLEEDGIFYTSSIYNKAMKEKVVIDFSAAEEGIQWETVNDVVMGGKSMSSMKISKDKTAVFQGTVSLENYGGFASVRTNPHDFGLQGYDGLLIRIKGDGKRYRIRVKTDDNYEGIAYQNTFATKENIWMNIKMPFSKFTPFFRGSIVQNAPFLNPGSVRRIGFMIAEKQEGDFKLEIAWVKGYEDEE
jgi:monofunctional biosynthetic peptidoglycan transglycosylase